MRQTKKNIRIITVIAVAVLAFAAVAGFWYWQNQKSRQANDQVESLGGQMYRGATSITGKLPETNPFEANSNPFTNVDTNPLEKIVVNPF